MYKLPQHRPQGTPLDDCAGLAQSHTAAAEPGSITGSGTASSGASRIVAMQARSVPDSEATNDSLTTTSRIQRAYAASPGRDDANRPALGGANPRNEPVEGADRRGV